MISSFKLFCIAGVTALLPWAVMGADGDGGEARLRESLRGVTLQLRTAQTDLSNVQAAQAAQADEIKTLKEQLAVAKKNLADDRAVAEKKNEAAKVKEEELSVEVARLKEATAKWKADCEKAVLVARAIEEKRAQLYTTSIELDRQVTDLRRKNQALYRLGKEVLGRYEKLGLGEQFLAREPFVGRTRVALENLVQEYDDKLAEQRAKP